MLLLQTADFIRRGQDRAIIEIRVSNGPTRPVTAIQRVIYARKTSDWFVDGKAASLSAVQNLCVEWNIQLDNMCQVDMNLPTVSPGS